MSRRAAGRAHGWRGLVNPFDLFVLAGGTVNAVLVVVLVGYWLLHG